MSSAPFARSKRGAAAEDRNAPKQQDAEVAALSEHVNIERRLSGGDSD